MGDELGSLLSLARAHAAGLQIVPASTLDRHNLRTEWPLCVVADAAAIPWGVLARRYPTEHRCRVLLADGAERDAELGEASALDARAVLLEALPREADLADYASVPRLAERLRSPGGCPWDREQTHATLRPFLLEETYEALDALDDGDRERLGDELGDLLLQVALHAQLAHEEGAFDLGEVTARLAAKLIRRHPHVFAGQQIPGGDLHLQWERIKREEQEEPTSLVAGLPRSLPALFMAERLLERLDRIHVRPPTGEGDELGARLFALVEEARRARIDAEQALRAVNRRVAERFERLEALARLNGRELETLTEGELAALWEQAG